MLLVFYAKHAIYIGAEMYSSPSIVVASYGPGLFEKKKQT